MERLIMNKLFLAANLDLSFLKKELLI